MEITVSIDDLNALFHLSQPTGKDLWVSSCDFKRITYTIEARMML